MSDFHSHFEPLRPPRRLDRVALLLAAPIVWIAGLVVVAWAVDQTDLIWMSFTVAAAAALLALVFFGVMRGQRLREERELEPRR